MAKTAGESVLHIRNRETIRVCLSAGQALMNPHPKRIENLCQYVFPSERYRYFISYLRSRQKRCDAVSGGEHTDNKAEVIGLRSPAFASTFRKPATNSKSSIIPCCNHVVRRYSIFRKAATEIQLLMCHYFFLLEMKQVLRWNNFVVLAEMALSHFFRVPT